MRNEEEIERMQQPVVVVVVPGPSTADHFE